MMKLFYILTIGVFCLVFGGCVEPYSIPGVKSDGRYLVVDAFVDSETKTGTVVLTSTIPLESTKIIAETGASVFVEVKDGGTAQFKEEGKGTYVLHSINLTEGEECRLHITTAAGKEYYSQYVKAKTTPPIDSITWDAGSRFLTVNVTTHDDARKSLFYHWKYVETYQYTSKFESYVFYNPANGSVIDRILSDTLKNHVCWKTSPSTNILIATTKNLSEDVVTKFPVVQVEAASYKNKIRYSLLVKQYVIDENEYNYWNQLKKNTESVGTLFDPQPSQITGNLYCSSDPNELVLGYFSVSSVVQQRIFIDAAELPYKRYTTPFDGCQLDSMSVDQFPPEPSKMLVTRIVKEINGSLPGILTGYMISSKECVDCRIYLKGDNKKPDFWE